MGCLLLVNEIGRVMTENPFEAMQDQFNRLSQENEELQESISELVTR